MADVLGFALADGVLSIDGMIVGREGEGISIALLEAMLARRYERDAKEADTAARPRSEIAEIEQRLSRSADLGPAYVKGVREALASPEAAKAFLKDTRGIRQSVVMTAIRQRAREYLVKKNREAANAKAQRRRDGIE